jgi:hypothetical protein
MATKVDGWGYNLCKEKQMNQQQRRRAVLTECKMPDLSGLNYLIGRLLVQVMIGEPGLSRNAGLYRRNFIRLVDKALGEYHEARESILNQIADTNRIYMPEFTDHIETCINAVARLYKLLDRIKSEPESLTFPREIRRLVETQTQPIKDMRNAVEHMDERIQKGEIAPGQPIMLALNGNNDGVVISDCEIKFQELAMVLKRMHEIAQYILKSKKQDS